jgi:hypothetical protein
MLALHGITGFTTSGTDTLSGFTTLGDMFVMLTGNRGHNTSSARAWVRTELDSTTVVSFDVQDNGTPTAGASSWSVFEFLDGGTVEKGEAAMDDGDLVPDTQPSFTALNEDYSGPLTAWLNVTNGYNDQGATDGNWQSSYCTITLDPGGAGLTISRNYSQSSFNVGWVAVEWFTADLDQKSFQFYQDGTESGATSLANVDTDISIDKATPFQIRVGTQTSGNAPAQTATLQYKETSDGVAEYRDVPN